MNYSNENLRGTCLIIIKINLQCKTVSMNRLNFHYAKCDFFFFFSFDCEKSEDSCIFKKTDAVGKDL